MSLSRRSVSAAALVTLALSGVAATEASAQLNVDLWYGKTKTHKNAINIVRDEAHTAVSVSLGVACKDTTGTTQQLTLSATGKVRRGEFNLSTTKVSGLHGAKLKISATVLAHRASTGKISWALPASSGGCTGHDTFKLRYSLTHGG